MENVLHSYTERGLQFVLATSRQHPELAKRQLARLGLYTFLEDVFVAVANCGDRKSDLTSDLNIQAIVGDTEVDLQWATELGVPFYAVNYGFRSEAFWSDSQQRSWPTLGEALEQICADLLVD